MSSSENSPDKNILEKTPKSKPADDNELAQFPQSLKYKAIAAFTSLPADQKRRVRALMKLQVAAARIEAEFFRETSELEMRYASRYTELYDQRTKIVNGKCEPTEEECNYTYVVDSMESDDSTEQITADLADKVAIVEGETVAPDTTPGTGIKHFWLQIMQNIELTAELIQECDVPILECLTDIRCVLFKREEDQKPVFGFTLEFHFSENDYFHDEVLKKDYFLDLDVNEEDPINFEGPEIVRTKGCVIRWKQGKNVTVKVIRKVQKNKNRGDKRSVTKTSKTDSFFNFFDPITEDLRTSDMMETNDEELLEADFEIGNYIRERLIPRAVLFYTGEALDDLSDEEMSDEETEEEEEDGDDSVEHPGTEGKGDCKQQ